MARDERKRQKALAKKKQRTSRIRKEANTLRNLSPTELVRAMQRGQWYGCYEMASEGIHNLLCIRNSPTGPVGISFLVDRYCLGVKDTAIVRGIDLGSISDYIAERDGRSVTPAYALKLITFGIEEAKKIGFQPPQEAATLLQIFHDVDPNSCTETFEFGKNGKPFYVAGPHDSQFRQLEILGTLTKLGQGNFHFLLAGSDDFGVLENSRPYELIELDEDKEEEEEDVETLEVERNSFR